MQLIDDYVSTNTSLDEIKENKSFLQESKVVLEELIIFLGVTVVSFAFVTISFIIGLASCISMMKRQRIDKEVSKKLSKIVNDGKHYTVRVEKSKDLNAYALPTTGEITYFTKLKEVMTEREFYAIMLHEVGHTKQTKKFITFSTWAAHSTAIAITLNAIIFLAGLGLSGPVLILSLFIIRFLSHAIPSKVSRMYEYDADSYAVKMGYGKELASALSRMAKYYKANIEPCKTVSCKVTRKIDEIFSTHPDMAKRIEKLLKDAKFYKELKKGVKAAYSYAASLFKMSINKQAMGLLDRLSRSYNK